MPWWWPFGRETQELSVGHLRAQAAAADPTAAAPLPVDAPAGELVGVVLDGLSRDQVEVGDVIRA